MPIKRHETNMMLAFIEVPSGKGAACSKILVVRAAGSSSY